ncbi:hypothetical protein LTR10_002717 [Elasticomyces elasticus]|nr:hypothetical protein LTR10_002717 [Elasticomyces elasticus]KAK4967942.1 hypothetical protein LTR42_010270 [Elasticomyces elasticus]
MAQTADTSEISSPRSGVHETPDAALAQRDKSSTPTTDSTFPFMRLPPELRLNVYDFTEPIGLYLHPMWSPKEGPRLKRQMHRLTRHAQRLRAYVLPGHVTSNHSPFYRAFRLLCGFSEHLPKQFCGLSTSQIRCPMSALLHTNHTIRSEAVKVRFGRNRIVLDLRSSYTAYSISLAWLRMMDPQGLNAIRKLLIVGNIQRYKHVWEEPLARPANLPFAISVDLAATQVAVLVNRSSNAQVQTEADSRLIVAASVVKDFAKCWNTAQYSLEERKDELIRMLRGVHARAERPQLELLSEKDQGHLFAEYVWLPMVLAYLFAIVVFWLETGSRETISLLMGGIVWIIIGPTRASLLRWWSIGQIAGLLD